MRENEALPEMERLEQQEFNLDVMERKRLQAEGEQEVQRVNTPHIHTHVHANRLKYMHMHTHTHTHMETIYKHSLILPHQEALSVNLKPFKESL